MIIRIYVQTREVDRSDLFPDYATVTWSGRRNTSRRLETIFVKNPAQCMKERRADTAPKDPTLTTDSRTEGTACELRAASLSLGVSTRPRSSPSTSLAATTLPTVPPTILSAESVG